MAKRSIATRRGARAGILMLALGAATAPPPAAAQLRQVVTEVTIRAEVFVTNFDAARLQEVEAAAASELADDENGLGRIFKFLDWKAAGETADLPDARLLLEVLQETTVLGPKIFLRYSAAIGDQPPATLESMLLRPEDWELYKGFESDFPSHDPDKLQEDLKARIRQHCTTDSIQKFLGEKVLDRVPLAEDLRFDTIYEELALPVSVRELKVSEDSRFRVELIATNDQGQDKAGRMQLAPRLEAPRENQCIIHHLFYGQTLVDSAAEWHPALASILPAKKELWVFMDFYDEDLGIGPPSPVGPPLPPPPPAEPPARDADF